MKRLVLWLRGGTTNQSDGMDDMAPDGVIIDGRCHRLSHEGIPYVVQGRASNGHGPGPVVGNIPLRLCSKDDFSRRPHHAPILSGSRVPPAICRFLWPSVVCCTPVRVARSYLQAVTCADRIPAHRGLHRSRCRGNLEIVQRGARMSGRHLQPDTNCDVL